LGQQTVISGIATLRPTITPTRGCFVEITLFNVINVDGVE